MWLHDILFSLYREQDCSMPVTCLYVTANCHFRNFLFILLHCYIQTVKLIWVSVTYRIFKHFGFFCLLIISHMI